MARRKRQERLCTGRCALGAHRIPSDFLLIVGLFAGVAGVSAAILFLVFGTAVFVIYLLEVGVFGGYLAYYVMKHRRIPGARE